MSEFWRRFGVVAVFGAGFLAVTILFGNYLLGLQHASDARNERQRAAICAILANIPGQVPTEIRKARGVFARPGHPADCEVTRRPLPQPTVTLRGAINGQPHQVIVVTVQPPASAQPSPSPSRTASPRPSPTPSHRPSPTPSPSPTCLRVGPVCV